MPRTQPVSLACGRRWWPSAPSQNSRKILILSKSFWSCTEEGGPWEPQSFPGQGPYQGPALKSWSLVQVLQGQHRVVWGGLGVSRLLSLQLLHRTLPQRNGVPTCTTLVTMMTSYSGF